jgi:beta-galactosidase
MKYARLVLLLVALGATVGAAESDVFPMAVWYGGGKARAPMLEADPRAKKEEWRRDLRQIKALGFNTVRCWIDWASGEPAPGEYRLDTLEVLLSLAEEEGLSVVVQVYMDSAPEWVGRRYPDSLFVSSNGQAIRPESSPGYCLDHPGVRQADLAFYEAVARRAGASPAFLGFDLWSEPHVINWANPTYIPNPEFCFCRNTVARFREWLKKKYGTLDALNAAWYRRQASWDEVEPNRLSTILSYTDYIDWKLFIADKLGGDLRARYEAAKRGAPDRVATSHAAGVGLFSSPHYWEGQSDDWTMAAQVDYYGTSFYPKHSAFVDRDVEWRGALLDFARSFGFANGGRGFWIGELQGGFGTIAQSVSPTVTPEDLRIWTWSALSRGAKAICTYAYYPMSTGYESGGFGLIRLDGTLTERARTAGGIARLVDRHSRLFLDSRPVAAQVAVVYNPLSHFVGGRQRAVAQAGPQGEVAGIERDSLLGIYRALFPTNVPLDYVHADSLTAAGLARYRLVVLPYPLMLSGRTAAELGEYVRAGGALVTEARAGWNDERGRAAEVIPGLGLAEVVGARESDVQTVEKGKAALVSAGDGLPGLSAGETLPGRWYEESLLAVSPSARVVARFASGEPAAVVSAFGKGRSLLLGSFVSAGYVTQPEETTRRFYSGLLDWAGVTRPVAAAGDPVEVRLLQSGREHLAFLFNHAAIPATAALTLRVPLDGRAVEEIAGAEKVAVQPTADGFEWRGTIPPRDVRVLRIH